MRFELPVFSAIHLCSVSNRRPSVAVFILGGNILKLFSFKNQSRNRHRRLISDIGRATQVGLTRLDSPGLPFCLIA